MLTGALLLITGAFAQSDSAMPTADMLVWPEGQTRRFYSSMSFRSPYVMQLIAVRNEERTAAELSLSVVFRCESLGLMRSATDVRCQVEDAGVEAMPMRSDVGKLQAVLDDWEDAAEAATVYFRVRQDGRVDRVRIEDVPAREPRQRFIAEKLELFMARLLSPLDLELPSAEAPSWKHRSPSVGRMPFSAAGGSLKLTQSAVQQSDSILVSGAGQGQWVGQFTFSMDATTQHQIDPVNHRIMRASVDVHGVANIDTGRLSYSMAGYIADIGDQSLDAPLTSWDLSVPR